MRKEKTLIIIGIWVLVLPFLGFPSFWRAFLFEITGLIILYLAYLFYIEAKAILYKNNIETKSFIDNINNEE